MEQHKNSMSNDDKIVLSYYDCLIRQSDKNLLTGKYWLNDIIIGFYMEYLNNNIVSKIDDKKIVLASPELTQLLKMMEPSDYSTILDSFINKDNINLIFFPLNDSDNCEEIGGSHWSLLIYSHNENSCYHYDSCHGGNDDIAKKFSKKIFKYFSLNNNGIFINAKCLQQKNAYDCGIFVLCFTELICQKLLTKQCDNIKDCDTSDVVNYVSSKRNDINELIESLS
ncbi:sentrin-specific protease 8-like [Aphidius gifuensis]|uniref:sentrin-specific protease 8-like n=1 Tax=Aphidius gifuensis TaxID=684658 RepID=UPI001CDC702A|nr:sentrin-specific protease 8-like [Aphidius gifuensis]